MSMVCIHQTWDKGQRIIFLATDYISAQKVARYANNTRFTVGEVLTVWYV